MINAVVEKEMVGKGSVIDTTVWRFCVVSVFWFEVIAVFFLKGLCCFCVFYLWLRNELLIDINHMEALNPNNVKLFQILWCYCQVGESQWELENSVKKIFQMYS